VFNLCISDSVLIQKSPFEAAKLVSDASKLVSDKSGIRPVEPLCGYKMHLSLSQWNHSFCEQNYSSHTFRPSGILTRMMSIVDPPY